MVVRLSKRKLVKAFKDKLDAIDVREWEKTGKLYFPVRLHKPSNSLVNPQYHVFEMELVFETFDGKNYQMRMAKMQRVAEGQEHA